MLLVDPIERQYLTDVSRLYWFVLTEKKRQQKRKMEIKLSFGLQQSRCLALKELL